MPQSVQGIEPQHILSCVCGQWGVRSVECVVSGVFQVINRCLAAVSGVSFCQEGGLCLVISPTNDWLIWPVFVCVRVLYSYLHHTSKRISGWFSVIMLTGVSFLPTTNWLHKLIADVSTAGLQSSSGQTSIEGTEK